MGATRVLVCHGKPLGTAGDAKGLRFWHAWVEVKVGGEWLAADEMKGQKVSVRRATYYTAGQLPGPHPIKRYQLADAERTMHEFGHYGPWVPQEEWADDPA